jgi:hypothetical protein
MIHLDRNFCKQYFSYMYTIITLVAVGSVYLSIYHCSLRCCCCCYHHHHHHLHHHHNHHTGTNQAKIKFIRGPFHSTFEGGAACRVLVRKPERRRILEAPRLWWEDNIKMDFWGVEWEAWTGSIWHRTGTCGGFLWMRWWNFGFYKMRRISWLAESLLDSREGLCSVDLVS